MSVNLLNKLWRRLRRGNSGGKPPPDNGRATDNVNRVQSPLPEVDLDLDWSDLPKTDQPRIILGRGSRYTLGEVLGSGGSGVVYSGLDDVGNRVAIKVLHGAGRGRTEIRRRFSREARLTVPLEHPNIVRVYDCGEDGGDLWLAMERIDGCDLKQHILVVPCGYLELARICEVGARAAHAAHEAGVLHRDLKPENILIESKTHRVVVTDFGIGRPIDREAMTVLTKTIHSLGTPGFLPPEQLGGGFGHSREDGVWSDVYGIGATLYWCLTGGPPFGRDASDSVAEVFRQVNEETPVPPRAIHPAAPLALERICLRCLQKDPMMRYGSCEELAEDLRRFRASEPVQARAAGLLELLRDWRRRKPVAARLSGLAFGIAMVGIVGISWQWHQATQARDEAGRRRDLLRLEKANLQLANGEVAVGLAELNQALEENPGNQAAEIRRFNGLQQHDLPIRLSACDVDVAHVPSGTIAADGARWLAWSGSRWMTGSTVGGSAGLTNHSMGDVSKVHGFSRSGEYGLIFVSGTAFEIVSLEGAANRRVDATFPVESVGMGGRLAVVAGRKTWRTVDLATGECSDRRVMPVDVSPGECAVSDNDEWVALATTNQVRVASTTDGTSQTLEVQGAGIVRTSFSGRRLFAWNTGNWMSACFDPASSRWKVGYRGSFAAPVLVAALDPTAEHVVSVRSDGVVQRVPMNAGGEATSMTTSLKTRVTVAAISAEWGLAALGDDLGNIQIMDTLRLRSRGTIASPGMTWAGLHISPTGDRLMALALHGPHQVELWKLPKSRQALHPTPLPLVMPNDSVRWVCDPDGDNVVIVQKRGGETRLTWRGLRDWEAKRLELADVAFGDGMIATSPERAQVAVVMADGDCRVFSRGSSAISNYVVKGPVGHPQFFAGEVGLAVTGSNKVTFHWLDGRREPIEVAMDSVVREFRVSPAGGRMAVLTTGKFSIWEGLANGRPVKVADQEVPTAADTWKIDLDARRFVAVVGREIHELGRERKILKLPFVGQERVLSLAMHPDGRRSFLGLLSGGVWVSDAHSGIATPLTSMPGPVADLEVSPDGSQLLLATSKEVRIWDADSGRALADPWELPRVSGARFSPSGRFVVTDTGECWEVPTRGTLNEWRGFFSAKSNRIGEHISPNLHTSVENLRAHRWASMRVRFNDGWDAVRNSWTLAEVLSLSGHDAHEREVNSGWRQISGSECP